MQSEPVKWPCLIEWIIGWNVLGIQIHNNYNNNVMGRQF